MTAIIMRGDAGNLLLPDESVDLIVTSPPYFGLRSYTDGGQHYAEQIGAEATPAEYLDALMACTAEWMRVLKPSGSIFVNLGDKYATAGTRQGNAGNKDNITVVATAKHYGRRPEGFQNKSLMMLPQRYAIRAMDELGLILRAEIIWAKPNGLPESVTDRVRRSHEQVFHFTKAQRYYSAVDHIREAHLTPGIGTGRRHDGPAFSGMKNGGGDGSRQTDGNPLGKLPGSVWTIATTPLRVPAELEVDHFAAYPPELVRRIVLGWSPRNVCTACGEGRRPVKTTEKELHRPSGAERIGTHMDSVSGVHRVRSNVGNVRSVHQITGDTCACPDTSAGSTPGVVLDPFGGTGTTALVASVHGRVGLSNDLSDDYCRLARWRTTDPKQRAKAAGMAPKPAKVPPQVEQLPEPEHVPGQLDLLGGVA